MPSADDLKVKEADPNDPLNNGIVIVDEKGRRAWSGDGATRAEAATEAVRKLLKDRHVRGYLGE